MRDAVTAYVKRVKELVEHVRGNEQATKQSLIGPLFTILGYDLTDPRECTPEFRADFGKDRSVKPVDWAFLQNGRPSFFVEAKDANKRLLGYNEQLGDYFAKAPEAKLGILTTGAQWWFFTDVENANVMDKEPFLKWDVISDDQPPFDFLTLLQKSQFNPELIRTFAMRKRHQNLLVAELTRLLEPSAEFTKLAIENIETRNLTSAVVENWKPVVANAINEWAKQRTLSSVLNSPQRNEMTNEPASSTSSRVETSPEELQGFGVVQRLLGPDRPVEYEDTASYFKIHLPKQSFWAVCRFYFKQRKTNVWVPLSLETSQPLLPTHSMVSPYTEWTNISLNNPADLESLGEVLRVAWDRQWSRRGKTPEVESEYQE